MIYQNHNHRQKKQNKKLIQITKQNKTPNKTVNQNKKATQNQTKTLNKK